MGDPWRKYPLLTSRQAYKMDHFLMKKPLGFASRCCRHSGYSHSWRLFHRQGLSGPGYEPFSMDEDPPRLSDSSSGAKRS